MDKINAAKNVDEYITQFPAGVRTALEKIRKTIKQAAPKAEECISYAMPAYKYKGVLVYFAGYKNHIGFYGTPMGHEAFKKELSGYKSGKGSVQFPLEKPLPLQLISKIVKFRVADNEKKSAPRKPAKVAIKNSTSAKISNEKKVKNWLNELEPVIIERTLNAPVEKVWQAITDNTAMKKWYFDIAAFKPKVGFEFSFAGEGNDGEKYNHLCKITEVVPQKTLTYSWRYVGFEGISFVTFKLMVDGGKTKLTLTHRGLHTFPSTTNKAFAKENFVAGWTYLIGTSLKDFTENAS